MPLCLVWVAGNNTPFPVSWHGYAAVLTVYPNGNARRARGRPGIPRGKREPRLAGVGSKGDTLLKSGISKRESSACDALERPNSITAEFCFVS